MQDILWTAFADELEKLAEDPSRPLAFSTNEKKPAPFAGESPEEVKPPKVYTAKINKAGNFKRDSFLPNRYYSAKREAAKAKKVWGL